MQIKGLYDVIGLPSHYMVELPNGKCCLFYCTPYREITAKDLIPCTLVPTSPKVVPTIEWIPGFYKMKVGA